MTALLDEHPRLGVEPVLLELRIAASSTYYRWRRAKREPCERVRRAAFVAEHGTLKQQQAVKHLKKWRGYSRKIYPAIEVTSDFPTVAYEADGATNDVLALEKQSQYIAEAFAAW